MEHSLLQFLAKVMCLNCSFSWIFYSDSFSTSATIKLNQPLSAFCLPVVTAVVCSRPSQSGCLSQVVTSCYKLLQVVTQVVTGCYKLFQVVTQVVTSCYKLLQDVTCCHKLLQNVTRCYNMLQVVKRCYKILQDVTSCYKWLQIVSSC